MLLEVILSYPSQFRVVIYFCAQKVRLQMFFKLSVRKVGTIVHLNAISIGIACILFLTACSEEPTQKADNDNTVVETISKKAVSNPPHPPQLSAPIATIETPQIQSLQKGEFFSFRETGQEPIPFIIEKRDTDVNGTTLLTGTYQGSKGLYRLTATAGESITYGRIQTPTTTYTFTIEDGEITIVDLQGPNSGLVPKNADDVKIPERNKENSTGDIGTPESTTPPKEYSPPNIDGKTTVDLMIVYSDEFAAAHSGDALQTRLSHLVSVANNLYENSNINIYLRLVHSFQVSHPGNTSNNASLDAITAGSGVFTTVETTRQEHGADLVTFIRPYNLSVDSGCGVAWLLGTNSYDFTHDDAYAYSVVNDGSDPSGYYCSEQTLTHELGHNMGSAHDRAHLSKDIYGNDIVGVYDYSFGHGIENNFGTVMSYYRPEIDYFSNPDITCDTGPPAVSCGVSEGQPNSANNALSLNNAAASIAGFVAAKYSADIDGDGQTDLTDTVKALKILTGQTITGTLDSKQDINDDGQLGLAEAIHSLQKSTN